MAKNISTTKKTINEVYSATDSDNWNADRYIIYGNYLDESILPISNILDEYFDYFQTLLIDVDIDEKFFYQPAAFSNYLYGTPDLDFMVLYFAQIPTFLDFNRKKIKVLPQSRLGEINQLANVYKETVQKSYNSPVLFEKLEDISIDIDKKYY